jgi:hypothetical protein
VPDAVTSAPFTLPRAALPAQVLLTQGGPRPGHVFVMERVPQHDGPETVMEMLNRSEGFFAFRAEGAADVLLLSKSHTVSVSVDRQAPITDPARLTAAKMVGLELALAGGTKLAGWASVEMPPQHSRLLDYLNAARDAFFAVWTHAATHYVNPAHVLYARPLD